VQAGAELVVQCTGASGGVSRWLQGASGAARPELWPCEVMTSWGLLAGGGGGGVPDVIHPLMSGDPDLLPAVAVLQEMLPLAAGHGQMPRVLIVECFPA